MTREEAKRYLAHLKRWQFVPDNLTDEALDMAIKALDQEPSCSENPNKWISVSERYPTDTNKCYLVCYEDGCITIEHLYFDDDGYPFFSAMELGVVAWMPLPEPYKASPTGAEGSEE